MPNENAPLRAAGALERRVDRLTAAVAVLAVGFALAVVWALLPRPELSAARFMLRDDVGRWRGALALDPEGNPTVRLNDPDGRALLYGVVRSDGTPRLRLSDASGRNRVVLEIAVDGSPRAHLLDADGRTGVQAWLEPDGRPRLDVRWGSSFRHVTLPDSTGGGGALAR
jgi:hypothetical protein